MFGSIRIHTICFDQMFGSIRIIYKKSEKSGQWSWAKNRVVETKIVFFLKKNLKSIELRWLPERFPHVGNYYFEKSKWLMT